VIELLNQYYVPVTSSNESVEGNGSASPDEKAERRRIYNDFYTKGLGVGDVHVYILGPDRSSVGGLGIGNALEPEKMIQMLEAMAQKLHIAGGPPVIKPRPRSVPPTNDAASMVFHLTARGNRTGSWREFPSENWVVLSGPESKQLLPTGAAALGTSWEVPPDIAKKFYQWFYPQTEDTSITNRSRIDQQSMRMTVVTLENGMARARIEGALRMKHSYYPGRDTDEFVNATVLGFMDFDVVQQRIQRLRVVTEKAIYGQEAFGVALRSVSRETLQSLME
jgi:hypothetical protein